MQLSILNRQPLAGLPSASGIEIIRPHCLPIGAPDGEPLRIKAESVAIKNSPAPGEYHLLIVTDSDDGISEIIEAILRPGQ